MLLRGNSSRKSSSTLVLEAYTSLILFLTRASADRPVVYKAGMARGRSHIKQGRPFHCYTMQWNLLLHDGRQVGLPKRTAPRTVEEASVRGKFCEA